MLKTFGFIGQRFLMYFNIIDLSFEWIAILEEMGYSFLQ